MMRASADNRVVIGLFPIACTKIKNNGQASQLVVAAVLKTVRTNQRRVGSTPTLSATIST